MNQQIQQLHIYTDNAKKILDHMELENYRGRDSKHKWVESDDGSNYHLINRYFQVSGPHLKDRDHIRQYGKNLLNDLNSKINLLKYHEQDPEITLTYTNEKILNYTQEKILSDFHIAKEYYDTLIGVKIGIRDLTKITRIKIDHERYLCDLYYKDLLVEEQYPWVFIQSIKHPTIQKVIEFFELKAEIEDWNYKMEQELKENEKNN